MLLQHHINVAILVNIEQSDFDLLNSLIVENFAADDEKRKESENSQSLTTISANDEKKEEKEKKKNKTKIN